MHDFCVNAIPALEWSGTISLDVESVEMDQVGIETEKKVHAC